MTSCNEEMIIFHHLGLGDMIECNGMVRFYCERYEKVHVVCKNRHFQSTSYMYRDENKITILPVDESREYQEANQLLNSFEGKKLIPGHQNYFPFVNKFESMGLGPAESFYLLADVPWSVRNDMFYFERDEKEEERVFDKLNPLGDKYIFIHDDKDRGYQINIDTKYKIIRNDLSESPFHLITLLKRAEEIHCMSSSLLCLIDCLFKKIKFNKLFLHWNIRKVSLGKNALIGEWEIIK